MHSITTMSRVLGVSSGGFYAWCVRPASRRAQADAALLAQIRAIHGRVARDVRCPRIHAELAAQGVHGVDRAVEGGAADPPLQEGEGGVEASPSGVRPGR